MPPISPASSLQNDGTRLFDDMQEEHNTEVEGPLEYRFDAASTSQSSLILPPQSPALGQKSFNEELKDRSVSLSMPSPEKGVIIPTPENNILPAEESFEERDLEEPSEMMENLILNYFSEKARTQDETNDDTSTSSSSPPLSDTGDVSQEGVLDIAYLEDVIDEDDSLLDLLLSTDMEEEFLKNLNLSQTESELENAAEVSHEVREADISSVESPTKLTEDTSILSQICVASLSEEETTESPVKKAQQFSIQTVIHENSDSDGAVDLSPLKSPTLKPKRPIATEVNANFMSPEVNNYPQKQQEEKETPDTLSMSYDAPDVSSVDDNSMSVDTPTEPQPSKSTGVNLQLSFAASAN